MVLCVDTELKYLREKYLIITRKNKVQLFFNGNPTHDHSKFLPSSDFNDQERSR